MAVTIGRIFISILVAFSYPLQTHPSRICLDNLYRVKKKHLCRSPFIEERINLLSSLLSFKKVVVTDWLKKPTTSQTFLRYLVETSLLVCLTFVVGLTVSDLAIVLALVGATGSTTMCYILPGLFYLKMEAGTRWTPTKVFAAILSSVGAIIMPTAIVFIFLDV